MNESKTTTDSQTLKSATASVVSTSDKEIVPSVSPSSISDYLVGQWSRNLRWRHFGGDYQTLQSTNSIVVIEEYVTKVVDPNCRLLKWSFGKTAEKSELRFGYVMKFLEEANREDGADTKIEWQYNGHACSGTFQPSTNSIVLSFQLLNSTVIITYRIIDQHSMAVCIVDIDEKHTPTIQLGNMYRIDPQLYEKQD